MHNLRYGMPRFEITLSKDVLQDRKTRSADRILHSWILLQPYGVIVYL